MAGWSRYACEARDPSGVQCNLTAGHAGAHRFPPKLAPMGSRKQGLDDNQRFALLIFALVLLVAVVAVALLVEGQINEMI